MLKKRKEEEKEVSIKRDDLYNNSIADENCNAKCCCVIMKTQFLL